MFTQSGKGRVRKRSVLRATGRIFLVALLLYTTGMFVIVTVDAKQLPVTAVWRVIVMVVVPVVDSQFTKFFTFEFSDTPGTHMGKKFQRLFPVSGLTRLFFLTHPGDDLVIFFIIRFGHTIPFEVFTRALP